MKLDTIGRVNPEITALVNMANTIAHKAVVRGATHSPVALALVKVMREQARTAEIRASHGIYDMGKEKKAVESCIKFLAEIDPAFVAE